MKKPMADDLLGRTYLFRQLDGHSLAGLHQVQIIGYDPVRGLRIVGKGFAPTWVAFPMWNDLHDAGLLEEC